MPSDVSQAVEQDQIAESLLGTEATTEETQPAGAEAQEEVVEETQTVEGELETESEETADDWLPTEQEKVFPADVLAKYAPRYGFTAEELEGDPRIARIVQDKLNSDIYINQLQSREEETEDVAEPLRQEPTPQQQMNAQQWAKHVDTVAEQYIDPDMAMHYATQFLNVFGVKDAPTPEMAKGFSRVLTSGVINVLNSVLPQMLNTPMPDGKTFWAQMQEQNYEGFGDSYQTSMYSRAWSKATESIPELKGKSIDAVGQQLEEAATKFAGSPQEFENLQFRGKDGKALSPFQNEVKKYSVLAKMISGTKLSSSEAKTFVEAGKKAARQQQIRRETGNLGSGKSNGQISGKSGSGPFQTNNDLFDEEAMSIYRTQHGSL